MTQKEYKEGAKYNWVTHQTYGSARTARTASNCKETAEISPNRIIVEKASNRMKSSFLVSAQKTGWKKSVLDQILKIRLYLTNCCVKNRLMHSCSGQNLCELRNRLQSIFSAQSKKVGYSMSSPVRVGVLV